jgi:hypothetical protein
VVWPRAKSATCLQCMLLEVDQGKIPPPSSLPPCPHLACLRGCPPAPCLPCSKAYFIFAIGEQRRRGSVPCRLPGSVLGSCTCWAPYHASSAGPHPSAPWLSPRCCCGVCRQHQAAACGAVPQLLGQGGSHHMQHRHCGQCGGGRAGEPVGGRAGGRGGRACGRQRSPAACLPTPSLTFALSFRVNPAEH